MSASKEQKRLLIVPLPSAYTEYDLKGRPIQPPEPPDTSRHTKIGTGYGKDFFASDVLVKEIARLSAVGGVTALGDVFHVTNANALPGIAREKALLASAALGAQGIMPTSGEYHECAKLRDSTPGRGLADIYGSRTPNTSYEFEGPDRFGVWFGISRTVIPEAGLLQHDYGDGLRLGPRIELAGITSITVPPDRVKEMTGWAGEHCGPHVIVVSADAHNVMRHAAVFGGLRLESPPF